MSNSQTEQSCGACRHLTPPPFRQTTTGDCTAPLPAMPAFPNAVKFRLGVRWARMSESDGTDCTCFERKEAGDEA